jgi:hypothetical protein
MSYIKNLRGFLQTFPGAIGISKHEKDRDALG